MRYLFIFLFYTSIFAQNIDITNGKAFTPTGELRALVIYVNVEEGILNETDHDLPTWTWDEEFPLHNGQSVVKPDGTLIWAHSHSSEFNTNMAYSQIDDMLNISEYFYHMSGGKFKFYAETLKDPVTNVPISIRIDPDGVNGNSGTLLNKVRLKLAQIYPDDYDWTRFDNRIKKTGFDENNHANFSDNIYDKILDYAIIVVRNKNNWSNHPFGNNGGNVGWPKAFASMSNLSNAPLTPSYSLGPSNNGHTYLKFQTNLASRIDLHIHEMAHNFMNMPHVNKTNAALGNYFHFSNGVTLMDKFEHFMPMTNAWEMWANGWIELDYSINESNFNANEELLLKDILIERSALRVKLPNVCDQYVWLQNHKFGNIPYYKRQFALPVDGNGLLAPQPNLGLYAFVENLSGSGEGKDAGRQTATNILNANSFKPLHGLGNHDFKNHGIYINNDWGFGAPVLELETVRPNPYSDQSLTSSYWEDGINGFSVNDILEFSISHNGNGGVNGVESYRIWEVDNTAVWGNVGSDMNITQNKLSAFTNPPITNLRRCFHGDNQLISMQPTVLHSLSISFKYEKDGNISVKVDYDDGVIEENFRATGNILLPNGEHISLDNSVELNIDKTATANRKFDLDDGTFFEPTRFVVEADGKFTLKHNSTIILENESTLSFKDNSILEFESNSKIIVKSGSYLCIDAGANIINTDQLPKVIVDGGFYDGPLNLIETYVTSFAGFPTTAEVNVLCTSTDDEYLHDTIEVSLPPSSCGNLIVNSGDNLKITSSSMITFENSILIDSGSNFESYIVDINVGDCNPNFNLNGLTCETSAVNSIPIGSFNKNEEFTRINDISVYPSPNGISEVLNISFLGNSTEVYDIKLFDLNGREVLNTTREPNSRDLKLDISNLSKGVYIIRATSSSNQFVKKVIIN